jgi:predicted transcriptional regulator
MATRRPRRTNRWALSALLDEQSVVPSVFATQLGTTHSTVFDVLGGRRDASEELLQRMADELGHDVRSISSDPYGVMPPLLSLLAAARRIAPEINGNSQGLRDAIAECEAVGL